MRIRFEAPEARGLRVIEEIPDLRLCHLEGRNGIGKTLSIRLLEIACGRQPYSAMPHAWASLRDQLGPTAISIDGLPEGPIRLYLTPSVWPEDPLPQLGDDLGSVEIAGTPSAWADFRSVLQVERIAGDETLSETLAREIEQRSVSARLLAADVGPVVAAWDHELDALSRLTDGLTPSHLLGLRRDLTDAAEAVRAASATSEAAVEAAARSANALWHAQRARARRESLAGLLEELKTASHLLAQQDGELAKLNSRLETEAAASQRSAQAKRDLGKWQRRLQLRQDALSRSTIAERQMLRLLGLQHRPDFSEVAELRGNAYSIFIETGNKLRDLDVVGNVRRLLGQLYEPLASAPTSIDDQIVIRLPHATSSRDLRSGVSLRIGELKDIPRDGEVESLLRQQREANIRVVRIDSLRNMMTVRDHKAELVTAASNEVAAVLGKGEAGSLRTLTVAVQDAQEQRLARALDVISVAQQLADLLGTRPVDPRALLPTVEEDLSIPTEEETYTEEIPWDASAELNATVPPTPLDDVAGWQAIAAQRDEQAESAFNLMHSDDWAPRLDSMANLETAIDRLNSLNETRLLHARDCQQQEEAAREAESRLTASLTAMEANLSEVSHELDRKKGPWSRFSSGLAALMTSSGLVGDSPLDRATGIAKVAEFTSKLRDEINGVRGGLNGLSAVLATEAARLSGRVASAGATAGHRTPTSYEAPEEKRVRAWAEGQLALVIGAPALRAELFDKAEKVEVDLARATVSWTSPTDSKLRRRPLEAFSSGEQVFAYTRAKLEVLRDAPSQAAHVVIVLDEFGAFVARDRFAQLLEFVAEEALGSVAEQIVVMLPLANDYIVDPGGVVLEEVATSPGRKSAHFDRVAQVSRREYFAVSATE